MINQSGILDMLRSKREQLNTEKQLATYAASLPLPDDKKQNYMLEIKRLERALKENDHYISLHDIDGQFNQIIGA